MPKGRLIFLDGIRKHNVSYDSDTVQGKLVDELANELEKNGVVAILRTCLYEGDNEMARGCKAWLNRMALTGRDVVVVFGSVANELPGYYMDQRRFVSIHHPSLVSPGDDVRFVKSSLQSILPVWREYNCIQAALSKLSFADLAAMLEEVRSVNDRKLNRLSDEIRTNMNNRVENLIEFL